MSPIKEVPTSPVSPTPPDFLPPYNLPKWATAHLPISAPYLEQLLNEFSLTDAYNLRSSNPSTSPQETSDQIQCFYEFFYSTHALRRFLESVKHLYTYAQDSTQNSPYSHASVQYWLEENPPRPQEVPRYEVLVQLPYRSVEVSGLLITEYGEFDRPLFISFHTVGRFPSPVTYVFPRFHEHPKGAQGAKAPPLAA